MTAQPDPVRSLVADVDRLVERDPRELSDAALLSSTEILLHEAHRLEAAITRQVHLINVRGVTVAERGRATRGWLVEEQHLSPREATRYLTVGHALPSCPNVEAALTAGEINLEHAAAITHTVRTVDPEIRDVVEKELTVAAETVDPTRLGRFAREIRSRFGPETAEHAAARRYDSRWVRILESFDGMHAIDGMLDPASAATLKAALTPLLAPAGADDTRSRAQRTADALVALAELGLAGGQLPDHGGEKPQVIVTLPYHQLTADLDAALNTAESTVTMNGLPVTPATARMIACDANLIPAVLGGDGEVLNLGRRQATWTPAQRRALRLEDTGCRYPGCQTGLDRCQIHHIHHWAHGGNTDLKNGVHLCRFHHWLFHHTTWQISKNQHNHIQVWRT
jgi:Domain of unknown function (DUF222)